MITRLITVESVKLPVANEIRVIAGQTAGGIVVPFLVAADGTTAMSISGMTKQAVATYSPLRFADLGSNATLNVKATPGNVFSLTSFNANAAARYLQLHNTITTPGGGAVPLYSFFVPAGAQIIVGTDFFTNDGANFSLGIAFAHSTTRNTYTAGTAADQTTFIHYA